MTAALSRRPRAAKGRKLFSLAAVCLLVAAVLAPTPASASRTLPPAIAPDLERLPALELSGAAGAGQAEPLPLYTFVDVVALDRVAGQPDDQVEAAVGRQRHRLHLVSIELARPGALVWGSKTATGVSTWLDADKHLEGSDLRPQSLRPSFQGLWTDPVSGLSYARNRWYDARSASWLSEDPMGAVDSVNLYAFVGWGPNSATDPMGLGDDYNIIKWEKDAEASSAAFLKWCRENPDECEAGKRAAVVRIQGLAMVAGGCSEAVAGGVIAVGSSPTVVGTVGGLYMVGAGTDTCTTGAAMLWSGQPEMQLRERALVDLGMDKTDAALLLAGADTAVSLGTGLLSRGTRLAASGGDEVTEELVEVTSVVEPPPRPSWQSAEADAGDDLAEFGFKKQPSFKDGEEVPYGTPGSVRPDLASESFRLSVDVKNYDISTPQGRYRLVKDILKQTNARAANLPAGMRQAVIIDMRGQQVSDALVDAMSARIVQRSNGQITADNVFVRR